MDTSWESVAGWYDALLDERGSDHYRDVILPGALRLLRAKAGERVLDVACGQGVLCRLLTEAGVAVTGVDASAALIERARARAGHRRGDDRGESEGRASHTAQGVGRNNEPVYVVGDARELEGHGLKGFDGAACVMALSNIDPISPVIRGVAGSLRSGGVFVFIIVHPAFRAAGQTGWGWDGASGRQYRRVDGYLSAGATPIRMHPGSDPGVVTWTFHRPLQTYVRTLAEHGLLIDTLEEWPGRRVSTSGPRAVEENRARREIPLFLGVRAVKAE